jgi:hypothetical protein
MRMGPRQDDKPAWTFGARDVEGGLDVAYVFAEDRSGATPKKLLEGTKGVLLVDGYSGYNVVDEVSTRRRAACHAHLRRYFHEALPTAPIAQEMLDLVAELYIAEHAADAQGLVRGSKLELGNSAPARSEIGCARGSLRRRNGILRRAQSPLPSATPRTSGKNSASSSTTCAFRSITTDRSARFDVWR